MYYWDGLYRTSPLHYNNAFYWDIGARILFILRVECIIARVHRMGSIYTETFNGTPDPNHRQVVKIVVVNFVRKITTVYEIG